MSLCMLCIFLPVLLYLVILAFPFFIIPTCTFPLMREECMLSGSQSPVFINFDFIATHCKIYPVDGLFLSLCMDQIPTNSNCMVPFPSPLVFRHRNRVPCRFVWTELPHMSLSQSMLVVPRAMWFAPSTTATRHSPTFRWQRKGETIFVSLLIFLCRILSVSLQVPTVQSVSMGFIILISGFALVISTLPSNLAMSSLLYILVRLVWWSLVLNEF